MMPSATAIVYYSLLANKYFCFRYSVFFPNIKVKWRIRIRWYRIAKNNIRHSLLKANLSHRKRSNELVPIDPYIRSSSQKDWTEFFSVKASIFFAHFEVCWLQWFQHFVDLTNQSAAIVKPYTQLLAKKIT